MAPPVKKFAARRRQNVVALLALIAILLAADASGAAALHRTAAASGWLLLALVVGLALYNLRKKLPQLPLGNSATWLQLHIYAGLLSGVVFGMHLRWRFPNGAFECMLATLYALVFLSGVFGLICSRVFARRLATREGEVLFARIPRLRHHISTEVERLVIQCTATTESPAVLELYTKRLEDYFGRPHNFWQHLTLSTRPLHSLLTELQAQRHYLSNEEKSTMDQIEMHVRRKDDLDYHHAHQAVLKYWLFAHIPLTYALLAFAVVHVVLVQAFSGGMW